MKNGKWKRFITERNVLIALLLGLVLLTAATVSVIFNQRSGKENSMLAEETENNEIAVNRYDVDESSPMELAQSSDGEGNTDGEMESEDTAMVNANSVEASSEEASSEEGTPVEAAASVIGNALAFSEESKLTWPVEGEILRDYSMDQTTWYATLEQYRTSPAVVIQAEVGQPVVAPANSQVTALGYNEEIGNYVVLDIGSEYSVLIGAIDNISVEENQYVTTGTQIATVASPTIYYTVEGPSIYFEVLNGTQPSDPLNYME